MGGQNFSLEEQKSIPPYSHFVPPLVIYIEEQTKNPAGYVYFHCRACFDFTMI